MTSIIKIVGDTLRGVFLERHNRFLALVEVEDRIIQSYLPNPGQMRELLTPGTKVILKKVLKENRKTKYDLIGVLYADQVVSIDCRVPNKLVSKALTNGDIEEFAGYNTIIPEYSYGHSRFDFFLANQNERCLLEVKSCTLMKDSVAMFPDAKTKRGTRHVEGLVKAKHEGYRACLIFIIQRADADVFVPHDEADPEFGKALRGAVIEGVEVYAYCSEFLGSKIILRGKIKVELSGI